MEAGVGAEGVEPRPHIKKGHPTVAFLDGPLQPRDAVLTQSNGDSSEKKPTNVTSAPPSLEIAEDRSGLVSLPRDPKRQAQRSSRNWVVGCKD